MLHEIYWIFSWYNNIASFLHLNTFQKGRKKNFLERICRFWKKSYFYVRNAEAKNISRDNFFLKNYYYDAFILLQRKLSYKIAF